MAVPSALYLKFTWQDAKCRLKTLVFRIFFSNSIKHQEKNNKKSNFVVWWAWGRGLRRRWRRILLVVQLEWLIDLLLSDAEVWRLTCKDKTFCLGLEFSNWTSFFVGINTNIATTCRWVGCSCLRTYHERPGVGVYVCRPGYKSSSMTRRLMFRNYWGWQSSVGEQQ